VKPEGVEPGVTEKDLKGGTGGRILGKNGPDIFPQVVKDHNFSP
jgi:hypothetical protein